MSFLSVQESAERHPHQVRPEAKKSKGWVGWGLQIGRGVISLCWSSFFYSSKDQLGPTFFGQRGPLNAQGKTHRHCRMTFHFQNIFDLVGWMYNMVVCKGTVFLRILTIAKCFTTAPMDDPTMRHALQVERRLQRFNYACSLGICIDKSVGWQRDCLWLSSLKWWVITL